MVKNIGNEIQAMEQESRQMTKQVIKYLQNEVSNKLQERGLDTAIDFLHFTIWRNDYERYECIFYYYRTNTNQDTIEVTAHYRFLKTIKLEYLTEEYIDFIFDNLNAIREECNNAIEKLFVECQNYYSKVKERVQKFTRIIESSGIKISE